MYEKLQLQLQIFFISILQAVSLSQKQITAPTPETFELTEDEELLLEMLGGANTFIYAEKLGDFFSFTSEILNARLPQCLHMTAYRTFSGTQNFEPLVLITLAGKIPALETALRSRKLAPLFRNWMDGQHHSAFLTLPKRSLTDRVPAYDLFAGLYTSIASIKLAQLSKKIEILQEAVLGSHAICDIDWQKMIAQIKQTLFGLGIAQNKLRLLKQFATLCTKVTAAPLSSPEEGSALTKTTPQEVQNFLRTHQAEIDHECNFLNELNQLCENLSHNTFKDIAPFYTHENWGLLDRLYDCEKHQLPYPALTAIEKQNLQDAIPVWKSHLHKVHERWNPISTFWLGIIAIIHDKTSQELRLQKESLPEQDRDETVSVPTLKNTLRYLHGNNIGIWEASQVRYMRDAKEAELLQRLSAQTKSQTDYNAERNQQQFEKKIAANAQKRSSENDDNFPYPNQPKFIFTPITSNERARSKPELLRTDSTHSECCCLEHELASLQSSELRERSVSRDSIHSLVDVMESLDVAPQYPVISTGDEDSAIATMLETELPPESPLSDRSETTRTTDVLSSAPANDSSDEESDGSFYSDDGLQEEDDEHARENTLTTQANSPVGITFAPR